MPAQRVLMVIDMQNGVFETPRFEPQCCVLKINQLIDVADTVIFIQHTEAAMEPGSEAFALLPELTQPDKAIYITKTACDAFYRTELAEVLARQEIKAFAICGCATDYCLDTTIKNAASRDYVITVAADAHTTADRPSADAQTLIKLHNDVWRNLIIPGNFIAVKNTADILKQW